MAELTAAMLCGITGTTNEAGEKQTARYLKGWMKAIRNDPKMLPIATQQAEKAARWIVGV